MTQIWQISAGDSCRDYTNLFLEHDLMFIGPGRFGPYSEDIYKPLAKKRVLTGQRIGMIRTFATKVKEKDIVLLRNGYRVVSIGFVDKTGYEHNEIFDDVFGWDLQHTQRVIWQHHLTEKLGEIQQKKKLFADRKQIPTFTAVRDSSILEPIEYLFERCQYRNLKTMPAKLPEPLTMEQFGAELFSRGLPNESIDKLLLAIQRQRRLTKWYEIHGANSDRPTEHEVVAHMILPFLLALGWSEQLLAVEWHKIDLAAFSDTPTTSESCSLVCEAKGLGHGLQDTFSQATGYVEKRSLDNCRNIVLTDGARLYLYRRPINGKWNEVPVGYVNINLLRTNHIAPGGTNAVDTIMALTPAGINREI